MTIFSQLAGLFISCVASIDKLWESSSTPPRPRSRRHKRRNTSRAEYASLSSSSSTTYSPADVSQRPASLRARRGIGHSFEDPRNESNGNTIQEYAEEAFGRYERNKGYTDNREAGKIYFAILAESGWPPRTMDLQY